MSRSLCPSTNRVAAAAFLAALLTQAAPAAHAQTFSLSTPLPGLSPSPTVNWSSSLRVCPFGCFNENTRRVTEMTLDESKRETATLHFYWTSASPTADGVLWQVANQPFSGSQPEDAVGLLGEGQETTSSGSGFDIDLSQLQGSMQIFPGFFSDTTDSDGLSSIGLTDVSSNLSTIDTSWLDDLPFELLQVRYYVRIFPVHGDQIVGRASNTVLLTFDDSEDSDIEWFDHTLPKLYDVQVVDFEQMQAQEQPWGCVIIDSVNPFLQGPIYDYYRLKIGKRVCPATYHGEGEKPWYESAWEFLTNTVTWVSEAYDSLKGEFVNVAAGLVDLVPGIDCDQTCRDGLMTGLNAGLVALGIPPELPNANELIQDGRGYLAREIAKQAHLEDCDQCIDKIGEGLDAIQDDLFASQLNQACGDKELAHSQGVETLCLPPGVSAHPAPGSSVQPARMTIRVRRNYGAQQLRQYDLDQYRLVFSFHATNDYGDQISIPLALCENDAGFFDCSSEPVELDGPLSGALFKPSVMSVPTLKPGESVDIPLVLEPTDYWIPERNGHYSLYNDWNRLYTGGTVYASASVYCPNVYYDDCYANDTHVESDLHW